MKLFKELRIEGHRKCIYPHKEIIELPRRETVRVFALGPPDDEDLLEDLDPQGGEEFPKHGLSA